jgi:high affinity choline transporter 7
MCPPTTSPAPINIHKGSSIELLIGFDLSLSIIVSGAFAVLYTLSGGLYSVAYTDVVQMMIIVIGLVCPFL